MSDTLGLQDKSREKQLESQQSANSHWCSAGEDWNQTFPSKKLSKIILQGFFFYHRYTFSASV